MISFNVMNQYNRKKIYRLLGTVGIIWVCHMLSGYAIYLFGYVPGNTGNVVSDCLKVYCMHIICIMMAVCADWMVERPEDKEREVRTDLIIPRKPMRKGTKFVLGVAAGIYMAYVVGLKLNYFPFIFLSPEFNEMFYLTAILCVVMAVCTLYGKNRGELFPQEEDPQPAIQSESTDPEAES